MNNVRWHLEKYNGQKDQILELRKIVFGDDDLDKLIPEFWDWEFENNYAGKTKVFLAVDDTVVGHYAVCPSNIQINGETKKGSIVVDVMTHPNYRFQGMFVELGKYSLEQSGIDDIDFSYGFPIRKAVLPGHLKIGWKVAMPLPVYVYPVDFAQLFNKFIKIGPLSTILGFLPQLFYRVISVTGGQSRKIKIMEDSQFTNTKELNNFINKTKNQHKIMQQRDFVFLDWRYNQNKWRKYHIFSAYRNEEMVGYIVLRNTLIYDLQSTTIVDIQVKNFDSEVINELITRTIKYARESKCALVGCMINKCKYKTALLKKMFIKSPYIFKFIIHKNREIDYEDKLLNPENWLLTWADTDDL